MSTISTGSLPPLLPQEMASILDSQSAVQALGSAASSSPFSPTSSAFLDLSPSAQAQMVQLEDEGTLFGASPAAASPFASLPAPAASGDPAYDPASDAANPAYADPADPLGTTDWSADGANPDYWA